jgi:hypothetical protein
MTGQRKIGAAIAIVAALFAAVGLMAVHISSPIAVGIAVIGIVIGTGVARGNFSSTPDTTKRK